MEKEVFETPDRETSSTSLSIDSRLLARTSGLNEEGVFDITGTGSGIDGVDYDDAEGDGDEDEDLEIVKSSLSVAAASSRFTSAASNARRQFGGMVRGEPDHSGRIAPIYGQRTTGRRRMRAPRGTARKDGHMGLLPDSDDYSIIPGPLNTGEPETKVQKLRRLIFEVNELSEEVAREQAIEAEQNKSGQAVETNADEGDDDKPTNDTTTADDLSDTEDQEKLEELKRPKRRGQVTHAQLLEQIGLLNTELGRISQVLDNAPDPSVLTEGGAAAGTLIKQIEAQKALISRVATFKTQTVANGEPASATVRAAASNADAPNNSITYELFYTPENAKLVQLAKLNELEARLTSLEKLVGIHFLQGLDNNDDSLTSVLNTAGSLVGALDRLDHHLALLTQPRRLDNVARRVKTVTADMERLMELRKKQHLEHHYSRDLTSAGATAASAVSDIDMHATQTETERRVNYLFSSLEKLDPIIGIIPRLITRLQSLRSLHTEAAVFSDSIKLVSNEQAKVAETAETIERMLTNMETSMAANAERAEKNIEALSKRLSNLLEKKGQK
ncbi:hypothetical protein HK101_007288 [Irineochytrium annulatum]|nr:hypothetical protein HK101_007288 [Irineochytrium annulatum]